MEITFKNSEDFFFTAVHPSGYHIAKLLHESEFDDGSSVSTYVPTILPNNEKEVLSKKKISLTEFFMDIESFRKECASPSEEKLFANDNFIEKLVNKYGFLEGTRDFWLSIRKVSPMISSFAQYNSFMSGEIIEGIPSVMLNDQRLSKSYLKEEGLGLWIWLLKLNFFVEYFLIR